jgi:hypothetical protein
MRSTSRCRCMLLLISGIFRFGGVKAPLISNVYLSLNLQIFHSVVFAASKLQFVMADSLAGSFKASHAVNDQFRVLIRVTCSYCLLLLCLKPGSKLGHSQTVAATYCPSILTPFAELLYLCRSSEQVQCCRPHLCSPMVLSNRVDFDSQPKVHRRWRLVLTVMMFRPARHEGQYTEDIMMLTR